MSKVLTVKTSVRAIVTETWRVTVPDDFEVVEESELLDLLDTPDDYDAQVEHVGDRTDDETDRTVEEWEEAEPTVDRVVSFRVTLLANDGDYDDAREQVGNGQAELVGDVVAS